MKGDSKITCVKDTQFNVTTIPTCLQDSCDGPPFVDFLQVETAFPVVFGTSVTVSCDPKYDLLGSAVIYCEEGTNYGYGRRPQCVDKGRLQRLPLFQALIIFVINYAKSDMLEDFRSLMILIKSLTPVKTVSSDMKQI